MGRTHKGNRATVMGRGTLEENGMGKGDQKNVSTGKKKGSKPKAGVDDRVSRLVRTAFDDSSYSVLQTSDENDTPMMKRQRSDSGRQGTGQGRVEEIC